MAPNKVEKIVKATCTLHNWLRIISGSYDEEIPGSIYVQMGSWSSDNQALGLIDVPPLWFEKNYQQDAIGKREKLCTFFNGCGAVSRKNKIFNV